jgi:CHAT domain-containing protein/tetratricopeptide (TPR) repeat protein
MSTAAAGNEYHRSSLERANDRSAFAFFAIVLAFAVVLVLVSGCTGKSRGPELLARPLSRFLKGGETYTTSIACRPGDEILLRVAQDNIDVTVTLAGKDGADAIKVDSPSGRFGEEFLVFGCESQSQHQILIQSRTKSDPGGTIGLKTYSLSGAAKSMTAAFHRMSDAGRTNMARGEGAWAKVLADLSAAGESWKSMGMRREYALSEFDIAYVHYMDLTQWIEAAEHASLAASAFASVGDKTGEAASRQLQGAALEEAAAAMPGAASSSEKQRTFEASEALLQSAEKEQRAQGRLFDAAMSRDYLALNYYYQGREDSAMANFELAERDFSAIKEVTAQRMVLQNVATINYENGSYGKAKAAFESLLPIMIKDDDLYLYASVLHNSALVLSVTGDLQGALERELEALEIQKKRNSRPGQARSLYAIGIAYQRLADNTRALEYLKSALELQKQESATAPLDRARLANQRGQVFATLVGIGNVERALRDYAAALQSHTDAQQYASSDKSLARIELALGLDYAAMGKVELALQSFERAQNRGSHDSNPYFVEIVVARAKALRGVGKPAIALGFIEEASHVAVTNANLREQAMVSTELASLRAAVGDREAALKEIAHASALSEQLRINTRSPELRAATAASQRDIYRLWINLLLSNIQSTTSRVLEGAVLNALIVADRSHGRALLEQLHHSASSTPHIQASDAERTYNELAGKRATLDALLERDSVDAQRTNKLREEIALLQAKADLANQSQGIADGQDAQIVGAAALDALRSQIPAECTVIEYMLTGESSWAWAVRSNDVALHRLPSESSINSLVQSVRRTLKAAVPAREWRDAAAALTDAILKPVLPASPGNCLIIIPDGALHYVPFELLVRRLDPLGESAISASIAPSLQVLVESYDSRRAQASRSKVAIFTSHPNDGIRPLVQEALQSVDSEVRAIQAAFGTEDTYVATSAEATRLGIMHFDFNRFGIIHIATHGSIDANNGALSRLSFGNSDDISSDLRAHDIASLQLRSQIVVLSACDSGLGQFIDGEGLVGFVNAFIGAGAESVLMSLWKVPDEATAQLMGMFYRELKRGSVAPAEALALAQREMESSERWKEPYFWAGFELFSSRPPSIVRNRSN